MYKKNQLDCLHHTHLQSQTAQCWANPPKGSDQLQSFQMWAAALICTFFVHAVVGPSLYITIFIDTFCLFLFPFFYFLPLQEMKLSEPVPFYGRYINNIILTSAGGILIPSSGSHDSLMMPSFIAPFLTSMPPSGKYLMSSLSTYIHPNYYSNFHICLSVHDSDSVSEH